MGAISELSDEELRKLAATHRLAAEEYERQLEAKAAARLPDELPLIKRELWEAKIRIAELEKIISRTRDAVSGHYYSEDDE